MTNTPIFKFFENFSGSNGRNCRFGNDKRAVIDSFEIYTTHF